MADIIVNYSANITSGTIEALQASNLASLLKRQRPRKVALKPNMVLAKPPSEGATTHAEVVEGVIIFLRDHGVTDIEIIESAWIGDDTMRVYKVCGYDTLAEKYNVKLYDLKKDKTRKVKTANYTMEICEKALTADFLINIPVLKAHCQTRMTCNLKNLKGCISDREKRNFHTLGLHGPIAELNMAIKTHFCVIDGICGDLTFEEGGNPVTRNMIICGENPLLLDSYCATLLGYRPEDIGYIPIAAEIGVGGNTPLYSPTTEILELNTDRKPLVTDYDRNLAVRLSTKTNENQACSACFSALINALQRTGYSPPQGEKIAVGQGFRGLTGRLGCGSCTSGFQNHIKGCPPNTADIVEFLRKL
ncbi:MAG: DUF362 domain-containing protein [Oscillospiraceae bacterium]|nr:DUF362 domain-containing protein [Oscillospiraceae bacterium]